MSATVSPGGILYDIWYDQTLFGRSKHAYDAFDCLVVCSSELRRATRHEYSGMRVLSVQFSDYVAALLVGMLGDSACVHNEDICSLAPRHSLKPRFRKFPLVSGSLSIIQLAPQCNICYLQIHLYVVLLLRRCLLETMAARGLVNGRGPPRSGGRDLVFNRYLLNTIHGNSGPLDHSADRRPLLRHPY